MTSLAPSARRKRATGTAALFALVAVFIVAGCSATGDVAIPRPAGAPGAAGTGAPSAGASSAVGPSAASSGIAPSAGVGAGCAPGLWATIKDHIDNPAVALVGMVDGCRQASIETTLDSSSVSVGVAICSKAAEVAYPNGVSSIAVVAADTRQIATGTAGAACVGQP